MSRHRLCMRRKHHRWEYRGTLTGWRIATCKMCGRVDLA